MAETPITLTILGDTCTLSIDPDAYLRVKTSHPGVRVPTLQGKAYGQSRYEKRASATFPLPKVGESLRIDIYNGDGEGTNNNFAEYRVDESGLMVTRDHESGIQVKVLAEEMEIEKIADNRYRLRAHGHIMTLSAEDLLDIYHYVIEHVDTLTREAIGETSKE